MKTIQCAGFHAAGIHSGLKTNGDKDLGIIYTQTPASVSGVFTRNKIKAAPVLITMERIKSGVTNAIIANSGNANCCNGDTGMQAAHRMAKAVADGLDKGADDILVASTGVIGEELPIRTIEAAVPELLRSARPDGFMDFAKAIMTTDTKPKLVHRQGQVDGKEFNIVGMAKGSGMIAPNMATMLCFICTDVFMPPELLNDILTTTVDNSLNRICIDGDTSTNDTALLLANGCSGISFENINRTHEFTRLFEEVLTSLAKRLVKDGEGVTKCVDIQVKGAMSDQDARAIADTISTSPLVKTALFGEDANWGRLIAAAGRAQVPLNPNSIDIYFDQVLITSQSMACGQDAESQATQVLKNPEYTICMDLNMGEGSASVLTCDFSIEYIKINADYRS